MAKMSKAQFEVIATMLGDYGKTVGLNGQEFEQLLEVAHRHLRPTNPLYSGDRVWEWANDVRTGQRDINGKRVGT